jgi:hypothetical protein
MFEAAITTISSRAANPSSSTSSWLSVWSFSPEMSLPLVAPTASSSSMKMIAGVSLRAWRNKRRIRAAPSPANISTKDEADCAKKVALDSCATALASSVLPVPGGPCSRIPRGTRAPSLRKRFGSRRNSTTSRSSSLDSSTPATSSQATAPAEEGLISCGLVRGMKRSIQSSPKATTPRKMIGSQITAVFWISSQEMPPPAAGRLTRSTLNASLWSSRENVWLIRSRSHPAGSLPPGAERNSRKRSRAMSQVRSPVSCTVIR